MRASKLLGTPSHNRAISRKIGSQYLIIRIICAVNSLRCRCCPYCDVIFPLISTVGGVGGSANSHFLSLSSLALRTHRAVHTSLRAVEKFASGCADIALCAGTVLSVTAHQYAVRTWTTETSILIARLSYVA